MSSQPMFPSWILMAVVLGGMLLVIALVVGIGVAVFGGKSNSNGRSRGGAGAIIAVVLVGMFFVGFLALIAIGFVLFVTIRTSSQDMMIHDTYLEVAPVQPVPPTIAEPIAVPSGSFDSSDGAANPELPTPVDDVLLEDSSSGEGGQ